MKRISIRKRISALSTVSPQPRHTNHDVVHGVVGLAKVSRTICSASMAGAFWKVVVNLVVLRDKASVPKTLWKGLEESGKSC